SWCRWRSDGQGSARSARERLFTSDLHVPFEGSKWHEMQALSSRRKRRSPAPGSSEKPLGLLDKPRGRLLNCCFSASPSKEGSTHGKNRQALPSSHPRLGPGRIHRRGLRG